MRGTGCDLGFGMRRSPDPGPLPSLDDTTNGAVRVF